ncbi:glycosyltransferase family 2 protein [Microbacterium sp. zg-Y818]|uniref:glycosyltransferase family 2 protein n=1 Tax=unclassified Microbacterium TaxID=2609290 RepID=UPI00214B6A39|nr:MULTISPECIES: glycosyltransferase family 2 protein [unclassified Microbacterium]MCR2801707.1 glycosyltransferase family 2 protein [Microbacterium sp. zg.Y818]WIM23026.1 glycosyltransferase family 2 protein [Microbacterium sp. zg-Y818]
MRSPKIVMTLMVRDEADIVAAMIEHHLAQGIDLIIVTDNGSVDGTREILARYEETGRVEVHDYLQHDKNQTMVVSQMASRAKTVHDADWVINADADEFFVARDPELSVRDALAHVDPAIGSFLAPVKNMSGVPSHTVADLTTFVWRDERAEETLMETSALHAHPSADAIHVGAADVLVQQGNHGVSIPSLGEPDDAYAIDVLHVPWRSYAQYSTKVVNTGRSYDANPTLNPSPKHHGMRDYRFWKAGLLEPVYLVRHPVGPNPEGFVFDARLRESLTALREGGALLPDDFLRTVSGDSDPYSEEDVTGARPIADIVIRLEMEHLEASTHWRDLYRSEARRARLAEEQARENAELLAVMRARPEARVRRAAGGVLRRLRVLRRP